MPIQYINADKAKSLTFKAAREITSGVLNKLEESYKNSDRREEVLENNAKHYEGLYFEYKAKAARWRDENVALGKRIEELEREVTKLKREKE